MSLLSTLGGGRRALNTSRPADGGLPAAPAAQLNPARLHRIWTFRCPLCCAGVDFDGRHLDSGRMDCRWFSQNSPQSAGRSGKAAPSSCGEAPPLSAEVGTEVTS